MKRDLRPFVHIQIKARNAVPYTGAPWNLFRRIAEHKSRLVSGFTRRCRVTKLAYFEVHATMDEAIGREKQVTGGSRQKKIDLINGTNPSWRDSYDDFFV
jgi:putative endonuclease